MYARDGVSLSFELLAVVFMFFSFYIIILIFVRRDFKGALSSRTFYKQVNISEFHSHTYIHDDFYQTDSSERNWIKIFICSSLLYDDECIDMCRKIAVICAFSSLVVCTVSARKLRYC